MTSDDVLAMEGVKEEAEAYVSYKRKEEQAKSDKLKDTLDDIADEEIVHLGEFLERAEEANPKVKEKIKEGREEAKDVDSYKSNVKKGRNSLLDEQKYNSIKEMLEQLVPHLDRTAGFLETQLDEAKENKSLLEKVLRKKVWDAKLKHSQAFEALSRVNDKIETIDVPNAIMRGAYLAPDEIAGEKDGYGPNYGLGFPWGKENKISDYNQVIENSNRGAENMKKSDTEQIVKDVPQLFDRKGNLAYPDKDPDVTKPASKDAEFVVPTIEEYIEALENKYGKDGWQYALGKGMDNIEENNIDFVIQNGSKEASDRLKRIGYSDKKASASGAIEKARNSVDDYINAHNTSAVASAAGAETGENPVADDVKNRADNTMTNIFNGSTDYGPSAGFGTPFGTGESKKAGNDLYMQRKTKSSEELIPSFNSMLDFHKNKNARGYGKCEKSVVKGKCATAYMGTGKTMNNLSRLHDAYRDGDTGKFAHRDTQIQGCTKKEINLKGDIDSTVGVAKAQPTGPTKNNENVKKSAINWSMMLNGE